MSVGPRERIAFYPCCGRDYHGALTLLKGYVDHVVFCDVRASPSRKPVDELRRRWMMGEMPQASFILGDALRTLNILQPFDVFFYRSDSDGEGGSGIPFLGPALLPVVLSRVRSGGLVITDGSNGGVKWLGELSQGQRDFLAVGERRLTLSANQPFVEEGLRVVHAS